MARLGRDEGRRLFGLDTAAYERGRPGHPDEVYDVLRERCGLGAGTKVLEIGPGTGQATQRLLELGADPLVAVEPDSALADLLRERFGGRVEILRSALEDAEVEQDFALVAAASSVHWVDEAAGLTKVVGALRPGGWIALWWTAFGDRNRTDTFRETIDLLMADLPRAPAEVKDRRPFAHDAESRIAALELAGFEDVLPRRIEWWHAWDTEGIRALFGSFSPVLSLELERREELLDSIAGIAERDFGGQVTMPVVTALYTARKPER
jgi:SAM-dependent methyltransferase